MEKKNALIVFENNEIRRTWHNDEWYFSVIDVVAVLEVSSRPRKYWSDLKKDLLEQGFEVSGKIGQLKMLAPDGKMRETDCANTETMFRIIQSIPSKKAEPFKRWLAEVGYERVQEIENPELAQDRAKEYYEMNGYPKGWIEKRMRGVAIRQELTDEWKNRGIEEVKQFAILTNEISKATFGIPINQHKFRKGLDPQRKNQNLRDHMNDLELIFSMLGEKLSTEVTRGRDAQGYEKNLVAARVGGSIAGRAREDAEKHLGTDVVSKENYLDIVEKKKLEEDKK